MNHRPRQIQVKHLLVLRRIQVEEGLIGTYRGPRHVATSCIKQGVHLAVFFYNSRAYCFDHLPVEHVAFHKLAAVAIGKDMARAHVYKVGARRIFTSQLYQIVVTTGRLSTTLQRMP